MKIPKIGMIVKGEWLDSGILCDTSGDEPNEISLSRFEIFGRVLETDDEGVVIGFVVGVPIADGHHDNYMKVSHESVVWTELKET